MSLSTARAVISLRKEGNSAFSDGAQIDGEDRRTGWLLVHINSMHFNFYINTHFDSTYDDIHDWKILSKFLKKKHKSI